MLGTLSFLFYKKLCKKETEINGAISKDIVYSHLLVLIKYPSCIAAKVATAQTRIALYRRSTNVTEIGKANSKAPVTLFITEWTTTSFLRSHHCYGEFFIKLRMKKRRHDYKKRGKFA